METLCILGVFGAGLFIYIAAKIEELSGGSSPGRRSNRATKDDVFPNGYTYQDYAEYGFTEADMDFWGLDQPGAPEPQTAGWIIMDAMDGEIDGHIDWGFSGDAPDGFDGDMDGDFDDFGF